MDAKRGWASRMSATTRALSHRGAQGWRKRCCASGTRNAMRKSATVPISTRYGPALVGWAKHVHLELHMCTAWYSASSTGRRQPWWKMMNALRGQAETWAVGAVDGLD